MSSPRKLTPQEEARLAQVRANFQERRKVSESLEGIGIRVGVYSGKGGVGKTTVATNLAVTLAGQDNDVALFDTDIDCPNVTRVLRISEGPIQNGEKLIPPSRFGVKVMSMAFFQDNEDEAIVWRGPMIHNAISQFLQSTEWGELDYLVVDLPPGTSDSPLTIMQTLPMDGFVVVSTPQQLANIDARRCINMIRKLNLNVLGVVENYTGDIFGQGAGEKLADEVDAPFLGSLSLRSTYQDTTKPTSLLDSTVGEEYAYLAKGVKDSLLELGREAA